MSCVPRCVGNIIQPTEYIFYCKKAILFLSSSKILTPPIPLSARRVCPPPATKAGGTHTLAGRRGGWGQYFGRRATQDCPHTVKYVLCDIATSSLAEILNNLPSTNSIACFITTLCGQLSKQVLFSIPFFHIHLKLDVRKNNVLWRTTATTENFRFSLLCWCLRLFQLGCASFAYIFFVTQLTFSPVSNENG